MLETLNISLIIDLTNLLSAYYMSENIPVIRDTLMLPWSLHPGRNEGLCRISVQRKKYNSVELSNLKSV